MSQTPPESSSSVPSGPQTGLIHRISRIPTPLIFAVSVAIAVVLLWMEGSISQVGDAIRGANLVQIVAGMLLYLAGLALLCVRWDLVVKMVKGFSNFPRAAEAFLTSVVINYAAPIGLAVPSRAALTKRALGLDAAETGAVALWEVAVDVIVLAIATGLWFVLGGWELVTGTSGTQQLAGAALLLAAIIGGFAVSYVIAKRRPAMWAKLTITAKAIATYPLRRPKQAIIALLVTAGYWVVQGAVMWILLEALDAEPSGTLVLGLMSLPIVVGMLSPVPGGAGIREALMIGVARVHGADSAAVVLAAVVYRIALFASIPILYAGVRLWLKLDKSPLPAGPDSSRPIA